MKSAKYYIPLLQLIIAMLLVLMSTTEAVAVQSTPLKQQLAVESDGNTLHVEVARNSQQRDAMPLVIFLVGSGDSTVADNRSLINFFVEEPLVKRGFAVATFDKRGTGKSSGVWYETSFEQRAEDAANVARALGQHEWVDKQSIYVVGHSQGGWIVQIALAEYPDLFAGGVSMAGPTFSVREQLINDLASDYLCTDGLSEDDAYKKAEQRVDLMLFFVSIFGFSGNWKQLDVIQDFTPDTYLQSLHQPLLLLFSENDPLVSFNRSLSALDELFPQGVPANIEHHVAMGQEHSFKVAPACYSGSWRNIEFSPDTRDLLVNWLVEQSRSISDN